MAKDQRLPGVLVVSNLFPPDIAGGAEVVAARQAFALAARGCRVEVFAGVRPESASRAGVMRTDSWRGLRVHRLALRSLGVDDNFHWALAAHYFESVLRQGRFDVVHFHNLAGLGPGLVKLAKDRGNRAIVTVHDHWGFCYRSTRLLDDNSVCTTFDNCHSCQPSINFEQYSLLPMRLRRDYVSASLAAADRLIFPSHYLAETYADAGFDRKRMDVVSNGIDNASFEPTKTPSDRVRFLSLAYLGEHKGTLVLLEALRQLSADSSLDGRWVFRLGGTGHLHDHVEREAASPALRGKIEFLGMVPRDDISTLYANTDVLVLASISPENEPVTLLECAATGTAQLATRLGGNPGLVVEGETGALVEPGDPGALAQAMRRYILAPDLARAHGKANAVRRSSLDEARTIDSILSVYEKAGHTSATPRAPVIVCIGDAPLDCVRTILENWHVAAGDCNHVRFVSGAWCTADHFSEVAAVWFWDADPPSELFLQAVRSGRPVLLPNLSLKAEALRNINALVLRYGDGLEALALLKAIIASWGATGRPEISTVAADLLAESLPREEFAMLAAK